MQRAWSYNAEYTTALGFRVKTIEDALRSLGIADIESEETDERTVQSKGTKRKGRGPRTSS